MGEHDSASKENGPGKAPGPSHRGDLLARVRTENFELDVASDLSYRPRRGSRIVKNDVWGGVGRANITYEQVLDGAPDPVLVVDSEGVIVFANARCEVVLGYRASELLGSSVETLVPAPQRGGHAAFRQRFRDIGEARPMSGGRTLAAQRKDGTVFPADISLAPLRGDTALYCVTLRDVTLHQKLEERVREVQRLESIGKLAGGIAHDLNNILTAMVSFGNFALSSLPSGSPMANDVQEMLNAADRAASLTEKLLAFARQRTISPRTVNLNHLILSLDRMLRRLIGEQIETSMKLAADLWSTWVDPDALEQVLVNLAINARDAIGAQGKLTIETENVTLDGHYGRRHGADVPPGDYVMVSVSDNGVGMSPEVQRRIFEPFFTTKPEGQGTGLGLATSFGIVKQAGGFIWVYSELGHGSTFKTYLPRSNAQAEAARKLESSAMATGTETVLVVEDDRQVRRGILRALSKLGYRLLDAADGNAALAICRDYEGPIDLLLTDVVMPQMNGRQLALAATRYRPSMKLLYISGYSSDVVVSHGILRAGIQLLQKPFAPSTLAKAVRTILDGGTIGGR